MYSSLPVRQVYPWLGVFSLKCDLYFEEEQEEEERNEHFVYFALVVVTVRYSDGQYCFRLFFFSARMITHEPLHLA